jgi:hypothetical protein
MSKIKVTVLCLATVFLANAIYLARYNFDFSVFVAAPRFLVECTPERFKDIHHFEAGGSDGGYNYLAAQDPLMLSLKSLPDCAKESLYYTRERILYHFLAWAIAFGNIEYLQYSMFFVSVFSFLGMAFYLFRLSEIFKLNSYELGALILTPGIWQVFRFDIVDLLWIFTISASTYCFATNKKFQMSFFLLLAMLTRSYSIGIIAAFIFQEISEKKYRNIHFYLIPLFIFYGPFKLWLKSHQENSSNMFNGERYMSFPFAPFLDQITPHLRQGDVLILGSALGSLIAILAICFLSMKSVWKNRRLTYLNIVAFGFPFLILSLNNVAWTNGLVQIPRILAPSIMMLVFSMKKDSSSQLKVVIPAIYLVSFIDLVWFVISQKIQLI